MLIPDRDPARKRKARICFFTIPAEVVDVTPNCKILFIKKLRDAILIISSELIPHLLVLKIRICKDTDSLKNGEIYSCDANMLKVATEDLWKKLQEKQGSDGGKNYFIKHFTKRV